MFCTNCIVHRTGITQSAKNVLKSLKFCRKTEVLTVNNAQFFKTETVRLHLEIYDYLGVGV